MSPLHGYRVSPLPAQNSSGQAAAPYGACLYLGPRGQRCNRPAMDDGFCDRHSPDASAPGPWLWFRRFAAIVLAIAILWPIIADLLNELRQWRR